MDFCICTVLYTHSWIHKLIFLNQLLWLWIMNKPHYYMCMYMWYTVMYIVHVQTSLLHVHVHVIYTVVYIYKPHYYMYMYMWYIQSCTCTNLITTYYTMYIYMYILRILKVYCYFKIEFHYIMISSCLDCGMLQSN